MTQVTHYPCYYIETAKGFVGADEFESVNDDLAIERAVLTGPDLWSSC